MAGADSSFVGGFPVAGKGWGAAVILSFFLTPLEGSEEGHRERRQGVGVKPVLHITILSAHSLLSLQEVESTAGKTWSQAESSWLRASLPVFVPSLFGDPQELGHLPLVSGIRELCPIETKASGRGLYS